MPRRLGRRTRTALRVLVLLLVTEAALRLGFLVYAHRRDSPCGLRPELLARLIYVYSRSQGTPDAPEVGGLVPDPHRGWRHAPGLRQRVLQGTPVSTNSRGFRGAREVVVPKPPSVTRVVALGDSFTFGEGEPDDATWPAQLEQALPGLEVVNLGERAYAHDQMYFALKDDGMSLQPDAVILGFYRQDLWRDELTHYCADKPRFSPGAGGWYVENLPVPPPWEVRRHYLALPLLYAIPRVLVEQARVPPFGDRDGEERGTEILSRIAGLARSAGARFILVNLPDPPGDAAHARVSFDAICQRLGAECVDPGKLFVEQAGSADPALLRERFQHAHDPHYTRAGLAVVSEALRRYLASHPITPR